MILPPPAEGWEEEHGRIIDVSKDCCLVELDVEFRTDLDPDGIREVEFYELTPEDPRI